MPTKPSTSCPATGKPGHPTRDDARRSMAKSTRGRVGVHGCPVCSARDGHPVFHAFLNQTRSTRRRKEDQHRARSYGYAA